MRRQVWRERNPRRWKKKRKGFDAAGGLGLPKADPAAPKQLDAADQLRIVMGASFTIQPLPTRAKRASSRNSTVL
jgi:hypothetical protein